MTDETGRVTVTEPALLIRIPKHYRPGMSHVELYDATRGVWRVGSKRERARLALLEAGSRPEEVEAERALLARLQEELRHLGWLKEQTRVTCRSAGVVVSPRLREKVGHFVKEGDLIAVVEDTSYLEAEVAVPEGESARVRVECDARLWRRWDTEAGAWDRLPYDGRLLIARGLGDVRATLPLG